MKVIQTQIFRDHNWREKQMTLYYWWPFSINVKEIHDADTERDVLDLVKHSV